MLDNYQTGVDNFVLILDGSLSLAWQFVHAVLENDNLLKTYLQGRVAMHLRCGGIFNYHCNATLSQSLTTKEV